MSIQAVIFDLGGVILRTEDAAPRLALAERAGCTRAELEDMVFGSETALRTEQGQATPADVWAAAAARLGWPSEEIPALSRAFFAGDRVDEVLVAFIRGLRGRYVTALLSNTWRVDLEEYLQQDLHIPAGVFDQVISSAHEGVRKPDARIYQIALQKVGVAPQAALFVDDSARNIAGAQAVGLRTVWFRSSQQARSEINALLGAEEAA